MTTVCCVGSNPGWIKIKLSRMNAVLLGYARLARPANLPTAAADILAGIALAGAVPLLTEGGAQQMEFMLKAMSLIMASVFLYAGGVVLNDVFDVETDRMERPERPIPKGIVPLYAAAVFGAFLLIAGILFATYTDWVSALISLFLAISILLYDAILKKYSFAGPLNMGVCRGLNLVLGMSILGEIPHPWVAGIPLVYIFAITLISRGEVHGNNKSQLLRAGLLYCLVIFGVIGWVLAGAGNLFVVLPFLLVFGAMIFWPLFRAYRFNSPDTIRKAVIAGVLSLIILDASLAVGYSSWWYGVLIILLLPLSVALSKMFAVT